MLFIGGCLANPSLRYVQSLALLVTAAHEAAAGHRLFKTAPMNN